MRRSFLWALLAVGAAVVLLGRPSVPGATRPSPAQSRLVPSPPASLRSGGTVLPEAPLRNVFEYEDEQATTPALESPLTPVATSLPPALQPSPQPTLRLVGIVQRGDRLCAALWIAGEVVVLAVGEEAEGYRLLGLSEDEGVRLRGPSGEEITLPPPGE